MALDFMDSLAPIKRLVVPFNAGAAPVLSQHPVMTDTSLPQIPASATPANISVVPTQRELARDNTQRDLGELRRINDTGSGISQIKNPVGRTLARIGDVAERILAPQFERITPGTEGNHQRLLNQQQQRLNSDLGVEQQQAQNTNLDLQPQLKQQGLENQLLKTQGVIQHQQDQNDIAQQRADEQRRQHLRLAGLAVDESDPSGQKTRPLRYEELSDKEQAVIDLQHSRQAYADAQAELSKAKNDPSSPSYKQAQEKIDVALRNANTAAGRLGLSAQEFGFNQDKFYNPQPTGQQRTKADLASSAGHYVDVMREVREKHPEYFGPTAGRSTEAQAWLGSQDPDAQRYRGAATVAKDHLTAVFGARSKYALEGTGSLFDTKMNNGAFAAQLPDLQQSIEGFKKSGTPHGKGGGANSTQPEVRTYQGHDYAKGEDGQWHRQQK